MGFFTFLDPVLNTVLGPLLSMDPTYAVALIAFLMTLLLTLAYKFLTDQDLMKDLKAQIKGFQEQMKTLKEHPEKMMKVQKQAMELNMKYMMHSMKPTLFTFIPIILIFGWLNAHMAFIPIMPGTEFTVEGQFTANTEAFLKVIPSGVKLLTEERQPIVDGKAQWGLKGNKGNYQIEIKHKDTTETKDLKIDNHYYEEPLEKYSDGSINSIDVALKKQIVLDLFGWKLGWLGAYIIFSIFFSILLRKVLKVH